MKRSSWVVATVILAFAPLTAAAGSTVADPPLVSETRSVPAFHAIELAGTLELEVTVGKPARVEIKAEADFLGQVTTAVKDGVLVLDIKSKSYRRRTVRAFVTAPDLDALKLSGVGDITLTGVANDSLALSVPGTGEITVSGSTGSLRMSIDGVGEIAASKLAARDAAVDIDGTGSASLRATQSLDVKITGIGDVTVQGRPARVKKSVNGLGNVSIR